LVALILTVALVSLAVVALTTIVILPVVIALAPMPVATARILEIARWAIALFVLFGGLSILYRYGPNLRGSRRPWVTVGAGIVVLVWIAASVGLSYYLGNFASYQAVYGSIAAVIGMLLWLYISAYLILLGAVLNAQIYFVQPSQGVAEKSQSSNIL
ncbi:MAG: YhjD/YihY/BrkB family envelope integrity protein, partial [Pseudomonadota bacterium]